MTHDTHSAENDAPVRGHLLTVTKSDDWFPDQPAWDGAITCLSPTTCNGWWECHEPHEVDGKSAASGPYDCDDSDPWCDEDEYEFHGVQHTWHYGSGWTVPYEGCVVQTVDTISDSAYEIGQAHGEGTYQVDDEWGDPGECDLLFVGRVIPPVVSEQEAGR